MVGMDAYECSPRRPGNDSADRCRRVERALGAAHVQYWTASTRTPRHERVPRNRAEAVVTGVAQT